MLIKRIEPKVQNPMSTHYRRTRDEAHREAKGRDATERYQPGEQIEVVIDTSPENNNGREAVAHVGRHNLVVFVHPGRTTLYEGAYVQVKFSEVQPDFARAVAQYVID